MSEVKQSIKKAVYEKERFIMFLKNLLEVLRRCEKHDDFIGEK